MNIYYDWRKINPLIFDFKAPHFSKVITFYDQMDDELKDMVFNKTKTCDGCGYCVQTDKTGKRPKLAQCLELNGVKKPKCPLFPSFGWDNVNMKMISKVKKLFDFAESSEINMSTENWIQSSRGTDSHKLFVPFLGKKHRFLFLVM